MPAFRPRVRALAVGVSAFALVAVAAGGTFAASNPTTLSACYDAYGNVRMGDTAQCKLPGGGRPVSWSTTGGGGSVGPTGPAGPTGAPAMRAWAFIGFGPVVTSGAGVASVELLATGAYCIHLTGTAAAQAAVASVYGGVGEMFVAQAAPNACAGRGDPTVVVNIRDVLNGNVPANREFSVFVQ